MEIEEKFQGSSLGGLKKSQLPIRFTRIKTDKLSTLCNAIVTDLKVDIYCLFNYVHYQHAVLGYILSQFIYIKKLT